jgi:hypothetical protein
VSASVSAVGEIEALHGEWLDHGRPGHDRFGLTVGGGSDPVLWLDSPDSAHAWALPTG